MDSIVLCRDFNITNVSFDEKTRNLDSGSRMKFVSYLKNPLIIQTPECYLPYGMNNNTFDDDNTNKWTMDLSFRDMANRPGLKRFFDIMQAMDTLIIEKAFENQKDWFRKTYPNKDVIEALYVPMIKYAKDKNTGEVSNTYPPTFKMKVPFMKNKFACDFYNYEGECIQSEEVMTMNTKGARTVALVKCNGIWFAGGKFGCSWRAIQIQLAPKINHVGCAIVRYNDENIDSQMESDRSDAYEDDD
jgi:hypothetical protein